MAHQFKVKRKDGKGWWTLPHMEQGQIDALVSGEDTDLHKHDQMYYTETEIDANIYTKAEIDTFNFVKADGTVPLTADWDAGDNDILCTMLKARPGSIIYLRRNAGDLGLYITVDGQTVIQSSCFIQSHSGYANPNQGFAVLNSDHVGQMSAAQAATFIEGDFGDIVISSSFVIGGSVTIDSILDQDDFYSDSDTALATQQSIKAYVDALDFSDYVRHDGTIPLSSNWDVGAGNILYIDEIRSRLATDTGLILANRGGSQAYVYIDDGSYNVGINKVPGKILDIYSPTTVPIIRMEVGEAANCFISFQDKDTASDGEVYLGAVGDDMVIFADGYQALRLTTLGVLDVANSACVLDEDAMGSDSPTKLATQQSIKKYVDDEVAGVGTPTVDDIGIELDGGDVSLKDNTLIYTHTLSNGTSGGGATAGSFQTCPINTEDYDPNGWGSLSSNRITLAAGTYKIQVAKQLYRTSENVLRLRNITGGTTLLVSTAWESQAGDNIAMTGIMFGIFTVAAGQALELQYDCASSKVDNGLGLPVTSGESEVYTRIMFERIK